MPERTSPSRNASRRNRSRTHSKAIAFGSRTPPNVAGKPKLDTSEATDVIEGGVVVRIQRIIVRSLLQSEFESRKKLAGPLSLVINGRSTVLRWRMNSKEGFDCTFDRGRVLYAGDPKGLLDLDCTLIESDQEHKKAMERFADFLGFAGQIAGVVPAFGTVAASSLSLAQALAGFVASQISDDLELCYAGSVGGLLNSTVKANVPKGVMKVYRPRTDGKPHDIEIHMKVDKLTSSSGTLGPHDEVVVFVEGIELDPKQFQIGSKDRLVLEASVSKGTDQGGYKLTVEGLPKKASLSSVVEIKNKPIYRGVWGGMLPVSLSLSVLPHNVLEDFGGVMEKAAALTKAVRPDDEEDVDVALTISQTTSELISSFIPDTKQVAGTTDLLLKEGKHEIRASATDGTEVIFKIRVVPTGRSLKPEVKKVHVTASESDPLPVQVVDSE